MKPAPVPDSAIHSSPRREKHDARPLVLHLSDRWRDDFDLAAAAMGRTPGELGRSIIEDWMYGVGRRLIVGLSRP